MRLPSQLSSVKPIPYSVSTGTVDGFETVTLAASEAQIEATFAPGAGMLGCSLRHRGEELLALGPGIAHYVRTGEVAGLPLLYPWANRLDGFGYRAAGRSVSLDPASPLLRFDPNGLPIHGLLSGSPYWVVRDAASGEQRARLEAELDFGAHEELLAAFPFPHRLAIEAELRDAGLQVRTTVAPTGEAAVPVAFGYHPYLRLPGIPRQHWEIELPVRTRLVLDERMIPTGRTEPVEFARAPLGERTFDDGFADLAPGRPFLFAGGGREIELSFEEGYPYAQVYAPPGEEFICFEPMTAPTNALASGAAPTVAPGESFSAAFRIAVATSG